MKLRHLFTLISCMTFIYGQSADQIVQKMIEAHGGYERWAKAPTISYDHDMVEPGKDDHWYSEEVHQQGSRRSYANWEKDGAFVANDGKKIWTTGWKRLNPPHMMAGVAYFFINMPWMTQDKIAQLDYRGKTKVNVIDKNTEMQTVRLTFKGSSPHEYFDMYIDPKTYLLRGVKYTVVNKALMKIFGMPADTKFMGPLTKVYKEYDDVNGLKLTSRYDTYRPNGKNYGIHTVKNYSLNKVFDESKLSMPKGAKIDDSEIK